MSKPHRSRVVNVRRDEMPGRFPELSMPLVGTLLLIGLVGIGIYCRTVNLGQKVYWYDEALTSLRITGHTQAELIAEAFNGQPITVPQLQQYQHLEPDKTFGDTLQALMGNAEHVPLYFLLAHGWARWWGDSIATIRSLSVLFSILAFLGLYTFSQQLFRSPGLTWMAIALFSVSPLQVLYAQEARPYSLWTTLILFSNAALLWAIGRRTLIRWGIYGVTVALGLYTFLLSGLVFVGHGLYVLMQERWRFSQVTGAYLMASGIGLACFSPWLLIMIANATRIEKATTSARGTVPLGLLVKTWIKNVGYLWMDLNLSDITAPLLLVCLGIALYALHRSATPTSKGFLFSQIGVTILSLMVLDLGLGWGLTSRARYLIPGLIGLQLVMAYWLSRQVFWSGSRLFQRIGVVFTIGLISAGMASCFWISQAAVWWNKGISVYNLEIAEVINRSTQPLLISDSSGLNPGKLLSLSHQLDVDVTLLLVQEPEAAGILEPMKDFRYGDRFVFEPSDSLQAILASQYTLEPAHDRVHFWRLGSRTK